QAVIAIAQIFRGWCPISSFVATFELNLIYHKYRSSLKAVKAEMTGRRHCHIRGEACGEEILLPTLPKINCFTRVQSQREQVCKSCDNAIQICMIICFDLNLTDIISFMQYVKIRHL